MMLDTTDNEDNLNNPDNDWKPPSDAEQKVLRARRERSDKISKRMAEYLLKGKYQNNLFASGVTKKYNFFEISS